VPAEQSLHEEARGNEYLPAAQSLHEEAPDNENVPAAHAFCLSLIEPSPHQKPAEQGPLHVLKVLAVEEP
jgi:hypothetical protein